MLLLLLLNKIFFYDYFLRQNELRIQEEIVEFENKIKTENLDHSISHFLKKTGAKINIYDFELNPLVNKENNQNKEIISKEHLRQLRDKTFVQKEGVFETIDDSGILEQQLVYAKILKNKSLIVVTRSLGFV
jgi:hypothetical protein